MRRCGLGREEGEAVLVRPFNIVEMSWAVDLVCSNWRSVVVVYSTDTAMHC